MSSLSVILPFFDETAFLGTALNSIFSQGIDDLEVIVVNDNPERFSQDAVAALAVPHPIKLIQHPRNLGLSAARNSGIERASKAQIAFLDSDDYYSLGGLKAQLDLARDSGADMTHAQTWFTRQGAHNPKILPRDKALFGQMKQAGALRDTEEAQFITSSWSSLYRADFLTRETLRFDPEQTRFEDRLFVLHSTTRARRLAFLGQPTRVWRGRAGSISVTATTPDTHLLQMQLLEKCQSHMRAEVEQGHLPPRFAKRELFNTVSRLIWDLDLVHTILTSDDPIYRDIANRIPQLLGDDSFGQPIFDDPVLAPISRVGMRTRKGRITRTAFFDIHKALREGDFQAAHERMQDCRPAEKARPTPRRSARRLVLHLGLHKTGSTYIQGHLIAHRDALRARGVLVPRAGLTQPQAPLRDGATPGHQGLVQALRQDDPLLWAMLGKEIRASGADTVVLSCENMSFPTDPDRDRLIETLMARLSGFDEIQCLALIREPHSYVEQFYREWVADTAPAGANSIRAFLVDHAQQLADLPGLLAPFEHESGQPVRLGDFDAMRQGGLWSGFCALADLPGDLPELDLPRYATPDRDAVMVMQLLNALLPDETQRKDVMRAWHRLNQTPRADASLLDPNTRLGLIDDWQDRSAQFAADRGYTRDLTPARHALQHEHWPAQHAIAAQDLSTVIQLVQARPGAGTSEAKRPRFNARDTSYTVTLRLRPWVVRLIKRLRRRSDQA